MNKFLIILYQSGLENEKNPQFEFLAYKSEEK